MPSLIAYRRVTNAITTHSLRLPLTAQGQNAGQELCTLPDGRTIVALFDGYTLPEQPEAIEASIQTLASPLPTDLREAICMASPIVRFINDQVRAQINSRYTLDDQIKLLRTAPSAELQAFNAYAESCVAWGQAEKAKYGL